MARHFGDLCKLYGIVTYKVSPMHLSAFKGVIKHGLPNTLRRCIDQAPYVLPPFLTGIGIFYGVEWGHERSLRKVPGEFDDDC